MIVYRGVDSSRTRSTSRAAGPGPRRPPLTTVTTTATNDRVVGFYTLDLSSSRSPRWPGSSSATSRAATETIEASDYTQATAAATGGKTATAAASAPWVAQLVALRADQTAPSQTVTFTAGTSPNNSYFNSGTNTVYYNTAANGDFQLHSTTSDAGSNIRLVTFGAAAATGFAGAYQEDNTAAYDSAVYSYTTANTTAPSAANVISEDNAGNQTTTAVSFARDVTAPAVSHHGAGRRCDDRQRAGVSAPRRPTRLRRRAGRVPLLRRL